jgi:hypothetical protein
LQGHRRRADWDHWNSQIWCISHRIERSVKDPYCLWIKSQQPLFILYLYISQQFFRNLELQQRSLVSTLFGRQMFITGTVYTVATEAFDSTV